MRIFKNFPKPTLIEKLSDSFLNYFERNKAPSTVSSNKPILAPQYWVYLYDENIKYVAIQKSGFLKYTCKEFDSNITTTVEKNIKNKHAQVSLHLKGEEYKFQSIYTAFIFGFFKLIYIYRLWQILITKIGLLGNKRHLSKISDRYYLLENISKYYNSHHHDLDIVLASKFKITDFIVFVLGSKNLFLVYDFEKRLKPFLRALSADNVIVLDRDFITVGDQFWAEYVRLQPKRFDIVSMIKLSIKIIVGVTAFAGSIAAVLAYLNNA